MQQNVYVTQTNRGCLSGCGTTIGVLLLIGLAVNYWYVALPLALAGGGFGIWYYRSQQVEPAQRGVSGAEQVVGVAAAAVPQCGSCGAPVTGNFCPVCGAAQSRVCAHCGKRGLTSPFCPDCGAATYTPPTPT